MQRICSFVAGVMLALAGSAGLARAEPEKTEPWRGPFGGTFSGSITVMSDYAQSGISSTELQPTVQFGLDWRSPSLTTALPLWIYVGALATHVSFLDAGPGTEIDTFAGLKFRALDRKLHVDMGYIRYTFPDIDAVFALNYGEFTLQVEYDFGPFELGARVRYSPDAIADAGQSWNKRGRITVPLPFLEFHPDVKLAAYGTLGNMWFERPGHIEAPSTEFWYWQFGLVTSFRGFDLTIAYTDTDIVPVNCDNTNYCAGRVFVSLSKVF